ncbi:hypothetical protein JL720_14381 [Aureococcus anophagefferens]|nr:hypothetical protein JL720_14381 [Aureococcus anophagefferens]
MGPNYVPGKKSDLWVKNIQRTLIMMGRFQEQVQDIPAGNTCGLVGVDQYLLKSGTITTCEEAHCIKTMKFSVSPVVRCAVEPKKAQDLPKLVEGLKRLAATPWSSATEESGEHIIAATGELHLEICLKDLQEDFMGTEVKVSDPSCPTASPSARRRADLPLQVAQQAQPALHGGPPLSDELADAIEDGKISAKDDPKLGAMAASTAGAWRTRKIWGFGPDGSGANLIYDQTKGVNYLAEIRESVVAGFQWASKCSVLCGEQMRSVAFKLLGDAMGGCYGVLARPPVFHEEQRPGTPMVQMKAHMPVMESFGFNADVRAARRGVPRWSSHWQVLAGDPTDPETKPGKVITDVRARKGLAPEIPPLDRFLDRL